MNDDSTDLGTRVSREKLLEEFKRIADEVGHIPRPYELRDTGQYTADDYFAEFGEWADVVEAAELKPQRADIIVETRRIQRKLDRTPTASQFDEYSYLERDDYKRHFDSWRDVLTAAEVFPSEEEIIQAIRDLEQETGDIPNTSEFADETAYRRVDYLYHFDSWTNALTEAGLTKDTDEVVAEISQLRDNLGRTPTQTEFEEQAEGHGRSSLKLFKSWTAALEAADAFPHREEVLDAIRGVARDTDGLPSPTDLLSQTALRRLDYRHHFGSWEQALEAADILPAKAELIEEICRLAEDSGRVSTQSEFEENTEFHSQAVLRHFESWEQALEAAEVLPDKPDILTEVEELAEDLGRVPTEDDIEDHASFRPRDWCQRFDSWEEVIEEAGIFPSKTKLVAELRRLKDNWGYEGLFDPTTHATRYPRSFYEHQFGSWEEALDAAAVLPSEREVVTEVKRLTEDYNRAPLSMEFDERANFHSRDCLRYFDSWEAALDEAGVFPTRAELVAELRRIEEEQGYEGLFSYLSTETRFPRSFYHYQFGSWDEALEAAEVLPSEQELLNELGRLIQTESTAPTREAVLSQTCFRQQDYVRYFNSINQAISEALRNSNSIDAIADDILTADQRQRLQDASRRDRRDRLVQIVRIRECSGL